MQHGIGDALGEVEDVLESDDQGVFHDAPEADDADEVHSTWGDSDEGWLQRLLDDYVTDDDSSWSEVQSEMEQD